MPLIATHLSGGVLTTAPARPQVCTGLLHPLSVPECCALLSTFVAKGKLRTAPKLPPALVAAHESLLVLARRLATLQVQWPLMARW